MSNDQEKVMIGKRLKKILEDNGFDSTRDSLIEEFGFNRSTLQKYLTDVRRPTLEDIKNIANYFNVSVDYLIGNTSFALDTWNHKYLDELLLFNSREITDHFTNRYNVDLSQEDSFKKVLYGLFELEYQNEFKYSLEDLSESEKEERLEKFQSMASIVLNTIKISMESNKEIVALKEKVNELVNNEYSFVDEQNLNRLENNDSISNEEKIKLLKTYMNLNMANVQKALNLLERLSVETKS